MTRDTTRQTIGLGVLAGGIQLAVAVAAGPLLTALALRYLLHDDAAFWLLTLGIGSYFGIFDLGLTPTVARLVAFAKGEQQRAQGDLDIAVGNIFKTAFRVYLALSAVLVAGAMMTGPAILSRLTHTQLSSDRLTAWALFVCGFALIILSSAYYGVANGLGIVAAHRAARTIAQALSLAVGIAAVHFGGGLLGLAWAWIAQNILVLIFGVITARRYFPNVTRSGSYSSLMAKRMLGPSLNWAATNLGGALILASGPVIVAAQLGMATVAKFVILRQLGELLYVLALLPVQVSEPFISSYAGRGDFSSIVSLLRRNARYVGLVLAVGAPAVLVFGRELVTSWVGGEYFTGYTLLALVITIYLLEVHHVLHAVTVMATGRLVFAGTALFSGVLTIAASFSLARPLGLLGILLGILGAQLLTNNWYAPWYSLRLFEVAWSDYVRWWGPSARLASGGLLLATLVHLLVLRASTPSVGTVALAVSLYLLLVTPLAWRVSLTPWERMRTALLLRRMRLKP